MQSFRPVVERYLNRSRLLDLLPDEAGFVVWLEAPYGYGKSVLASQWSRILEGIGWRSLWMAPKSDPLPLLAGALELPPDTPTDVVLDTLVHDRTLLVLEHYTEYAQLVECTSNLTGYVGIPVSVVDVDKQPGIGKHVPDALRVGQHVRPGDKAHVWKTVMAGRKPESAEEEVVKPLSCQSRTEDVVHADERRDVLATYDL